MFFCEAKSNYHDGIKQYRFVHNYKSADLHELIQNSISIFNEWPTSFYNFLDGMRTNLNSFYKRLYLCLPYPEFLFIHQEFVNYYEQNEDSIYFKTSYKETLEKKIISQKHLLIKSNQLNDLKYCTTNEVSDLLGLKQRVQIVALGKKEIIRLVNDANLISRYNFVFDRQSVENLLKEIQIFMQEPPEEITSIISFQEALRIFTNWGQKLTDFLHSIMTKQIRACGRSNEIGLYSFLFIASEVESVVKGGWLSINDIAHEQGIDRKEICSWIDKGFLPAKRVQNHYFLITPIDFQKFNELYVTARELVKIHPEIHSSGKLFRVLVSMGVEPVSGPKIDGGARYLYKRDSSLMQLLGLKDS
ncbi:hypothetical protein R70723_11765 [Paenibacillus sp. FSL R7-0273]|nr:hypothetical protein R70723_11765 [Paenibacillus sp. FSL R7-0273]